MRKYLPSIATVFRKEWRDAFRDKRSLRMVFLMPVYFVAIFVVSSLFVIHLANQSRATTTSPIKLPVMGAEQLPALIDWLTEQGVSIENVEHEAYQKVERAELDYVLIIPPDAQKKFLTGEAIELALVFDATNNKVQGGLSFIRYQINSWNSRIGSLRLLTRGVSPTIMTPVYVRDVNIASDEKMGFFVMMSLPMLLILTAFISTVGFSADMTAGERERRSLESLLITPATSVQLIMGKWAVSFLLTLVVVAVELGLFSLSFAYLPFNEIGLKVDITLLDIVGIFIVLLSVILIATPLQFAVSIYSRNFKDAQMHMGLMIFIPMAPLFYTLFNPSAYANWFHWVPVLGHQMLIKNILLGVDISVIHVAKMFIVTGLLSGVLLWFAVRRLRSPNVVYGA